MQHRARFAVSFFPTTQTKDRIACKILDCVISGWMDRKVSPGTIGMPKVQFSCFLFTMPYFLLCPFVDSTTNSHIHFRETVKNMNIFIIRLLRDQSCMGARIDQSPTHFITKENEVRSSQHFDLLMVLPIRSCNAVFHVTVRNQFTVPKRIHMVE